MTSGHLARRMPAFDSESFLVRHPEPSRLNRNGLARVAPEELQGSRAAMEVPRPLSIGWAERQRGGRVRARARGCFAREPRLLILRAGRRAGAIHKASDPGGGRTVGLGEDFGHGSPQPARRQALIAYLTKKPTEPRRLRGEVLALKYNESRERGEPGFLQAGRAGARSVAARAFETSRQRGDRGGRLARLLHTAGSRGA